MRILFDGYWWYSGPLANRSVQRDLIRTWSATFPEDELVVATRRPVDREAELDPPPGAPQRVRLWPQAVSNLIELPVLARRLKADVTLAHNFTPPGGRTATFIHDVMFAEHPEWFSLAERVYFALMLPSSRMASAVFTSTRTEAERITRFAPSAKAVQEIGLAVPQALLDAVPTPPRDFGGYREFGLSVGRLNVRKNLSTVLRGVTASRSITPDTPLLVVGSAEHSGRGDSLPDEFRELVDSGAVVFLGRITDAELAWLYRNTALVVYLSLDEGFGLPPIESVRFGAPLLVSDIPVLRETVSGYAEFIAASADPGTVGAAIDRTWNRTPHADARERINSRYDWVEVVTRLRASIEAGLTSTGRPRRRPSNP